MSKPIHIYNISSRILVRSLMLALVCMVLVSCLTDTTSQEPTMSPTATQYEGRWQVNGRQSVASTMTILSGTLSFDTLPLDDVLKVLLPDANRIEVVSASNVDVMRYKQLPTTDGNMLLSLFPHPWKVAAIVDGNGRTILLNFDSLDGDGNMSWTSVNPNGVLTLILRATYYSLDDGLPQPVDMRITYTATPK